MTDCDPRPSLEGFTLSCTGTIRIASTGRKHRFLVVTHEYVATYSDGGARHGTSVVPFQWTDAVSAAAGLSLMTGEPYSDALGKIKSLEPRYKASFVASKGTADLRRKDGVDVRRDVIAAIMLAHNPGLEPDHPDRLAAIELMGHATQDERDFVAYSLFRCNQRNRLATDAEGLDVAAGRVVFPGFEFPLDPDAEHDGGTVPTSDHRGAAPGGPGM